MVKWAYVRYLIQFLAVTSPLLSGGFSLLDALGVSGNEVSILGLSVLSGPKVQVEFFLRAGIAVTLLALSLIYEVATVAVPLDRLRSFRRAFLDVNYKDDWDNLLGPGFRLNIMFLRQSPLHLFLPTFEWTWSRNFDPPHHGDVNMLLLKWQGLAGVAVRTQKPQSVYFGRDTPPLLALRAPYYLLPFQLRRTSHLCGVLSVPILRKLPGASPSFKCVGVINIDAVTEEAAAKLARNEKSLAEYFQQFGILLGDLAL